MAGMEKEKSITRTSWTMAQYSKTEVMSRRDAHRLRRPSYPGGYCWGDDKQVSSRVIKIQVYEGNEV